MKSDDTVVEKHKFYQHKNPILIDNIDINKLVVFNKVSFDKKNFKDLIRCKIKLNVLFFDER